MVKYGHQDLILTTLLKASARLWTKGELRPNEIREPKYDQIQLKDVAMYLYKHINAQLCDIKLPSDNYY